MNSLGKDCNELKAKYDECFNVWFSEKFLKGDLNEDMCKPIFSVYQDCVKRAIKENNIDLREVEREVLGTPDEKKAPESEELKKTTK